MSIDQLSPLIESVLGLGMVAGAVVGFVAGLAVCLLGDKK